MRELQLTITKEDLETAPYVSDKNCPIARALQRSGMIEVTCGSTYAHFKEPFWKIFSHKYRMVDITELNNKVLPMCKRVIGGNEKEPETFTYTLKY